MDNLVSRVLSAGAYWSVNKYVAKVLGVTETILLMEFVSFSERYQDEEGWFYRSRPHIEQVTNFSPSSQRRYERLFVALKLIEKECRGIDRKNFYRLNEQNLSLFILDPLKYMNEHGDFHTPEERKKPQEKAADKSSAEKNPSNLQCVNLVESIASKKLVTNNKTFNNKSSFINKRTCDGVDASAQSASAEATDLRSDCMEDDFLVEQRILPCKLSVKKRIFALNQLSPVTANVRKSIRDAKDNLVPKVKHNRKLHKETIDLIQYWNTKPGLTVHSLVVSSDGCYYYAEQTKTVKGINNEILKVMRGELYARSEDIQQIALRTRKFNMDSIKKAVDRISLSTSAEYNGTTKTYSLLQFFYNPHSKTYPGKQIEYKYKYPFLFYVNGNLKKVEPFAAKGPDDNLVGAIVHKLKGDGIIINNDHRNKITRAVSIALNIVRKNKQDWKRTEMQIMTDFPNMFYSCYRDHRKGGKDLDDLWSITNYQFERHIKDKRLI